MSVTIGQIAEAVGVHPSTVSRALNGSKSLSESRRSEIKKVADILGYRPNLMAKALQGRRTKTIGIIAPKLTDMHAVALFNTEESALRNMGYMTILAITDCEQASEMEAIQGLLDRSVDGLIMNYSTRNELVAKFLKDIVVEKEITVSVIGDIDSEGLFDTVDVDVAKWSQKLVEHVIDKGHTRIALVVDDFGSSFDITRDGKYVGYINALKERNIEFDEKLIFKSHYVHQDIQNLVQRIMSLKDRPTAICAYCDELAGGLLYQLNEVGYAVPQDVSVIGYNDDWFAGKYAVPLTTCKLPAEAIANKAVELLMKRLNDRNEKPQKVFCESELVIRSSVRNIAFKGNSNE